MLRGAEMLMSLGVDRRCPDCAAVTVFLPVLEEDGGTTDELVCTVCDGAVLVTAATPATATTAAA